MIVVTVSQTSPMVSTMPVYHSQSWDRHCGVSDYTDGIYRANDSHAADYSQSWGCRCATTAEAEEKEKKTHLQGAEP